MMFGCRHDVKAGVIGEGWSTKPRADVLGQQYHVTGAPMDGSSIDNHNRRVYEEIVTIIKKAWTQETIEHDGEYYKVPYPYEEGIQRQPRLVDPLPGYCLLVARPSSIRLAR